MKSTETAAALTTALRTVFPDCESASWLPAPALLAETFPDLPDPLDRENLTAWAALADYPEEWTAPLQRAAEWIRGCEELHQVFRLAEGLLLCREKEYDAHLFRHWPDPVSMMGEDAPAFYALLVLTCVPVIRELHKRQNIPGEITRDTCSSIGSKTRDYAFFTGRPGMLKRAVYWFQHHMSGRLYRIGRFEYMIKPLGEGLEVLQHAATGEIRLRRLMPGTREWRDLRPDGTPLPEAVPADGWKPLFTPGDRVLDLHIPGGGGMTDPAILDSLERALRFYDSHFPETPVKAFECDSWIFSPDLSDFLDRESNLVRFRDRVHLFPVETEDVAGLPFIFNTASADPADWPENTSLQRALKEHLVSGGKFRLSGMILSRTELDRFRTNL